MGWLKTAGLSVMLFGLCFMAFFGMFDEMESNYGSDYNSTNSSLDQLRNTTTSEVNNSNTVILSHQSSLEQGDIASADAEDNLIAAGFSIVKEIFMYPIQIFHIGNVILSSIFGLDINEYGWLYTGIQAILIFLTIIAILAIIFKVNL